MTTVREYFDARAENWDANAPGAGVPANIAELAGIAAGCRVLDVGCGTGVLAPALLRAGAGTVVAIDVSPRMIECARAKFAGKANITFECADILSFEADEPFDCIVMYNMYPHLHDKAAVARKAAAMLAPGGRFAVVHGAGRAAINEHHHRDRVPDAVTSELLPAKEEARAWQAAGFSIDRIIDRNDLYCFGGCIG